MTKFNSKDWFPTFWKSKACRRVCFKWQYYYSDDKFTKLGHTHLRYIPYYISEIYMYKCVYINTCISMYIYINVYLFVFLRLAIIPHCVNHFIGWGKPKIKTKNLQSICVCFYNFKKKCKQWVWLSLSSVSYLRTKVCAFLIKSLFFFASILESAARKWIFNYLCGQ